MNRHRIRWALLFLVALVIAVHMPQSPSGSEQAVSLDDTFNLAGERSGNVQYFLMESRLLTYAPNGVRVRTDLFRLRLQCDPGAGEEGNRYTCSAFTVQHDDEPERVLPSLSGWSYTFREGGIDDAGQVFGIDHTRFEDLVDAAGVALGTAESYHVYNAFIDFHSFCDVFAERASEGSGIQDLECIGQKIVHAAAFTEPPVHVGSSIAEGSFFRNGEITLEFTGLSLVDGYACALLSYDSGESSFEMIMQPAPGVEITTVGSSHYSGSIHKDLASNWVRSVTLSEVIVSETSIPSPGDTIHAVSERMIDIRNVREEEFVAQ